MSKQNEYRLSNCGADVKTTLEALLLVALEGVPVIFLARMGPNAGGFVVLVTVVAVNVNVVVAV